MESSNLVPTTFSVLDSTPVLMKVSVPNPGVVAVPVARLTVPAPVAAASLNTAVSEPA